MDFFAWEMAGRRDGPWGVAAEAWDAAKLPKPRQLSESFAACLEAFFEQFSDGKAVSKAPGTLGT